MTGFIVPSNLKYAPYVNYYIDLYQKNGFEFEIISWDKKGLEEPVADHVFHYISKDSDRCRMMIGYLKFVHFVKSIIRKRKYDKLIVFTIAPAVFMWSFLGGKYRKKYLLDIRDDSPFVRKTPALFHKVRDAAQNIISSSPFFYDWIGKNGYLCHNCDIDNMKMHRDDELQFRSEYPQRIVFAGMMNEAEINTRFFENVAEDGVFEFAYWGPNESLNMIKTKAQELNIQNLFFGGVYSKDDIVDIYRNNADFVNIIRKECQVNRNALPNKLYDAVMAGKPVIVFEHNAAVAAYVKKYSLGIILAANDMENMKDVLKEKMAALSYEAYCDGRKGFIDQIVEDQTKFEQMVKGFETEA